MGESGGGYAKNDFNNQMSQSAAKIDAMKSSLGLGGPGSAVDAARPGGRVADASGILPALKKLQDHIKHLFETEGFEQEFAYLEQLTQQHIQNEDFTTALLPHNKEKNRYTNILPFERTRVKLTPVEGLMGSDYINANFMSGEIPESDGAYIAAQGPKEVTVFDFWRMVYEYKITSVVMLGNHIEDNKIKFWQYWPEDNTAIDIGYFRVTFKNQESYYGEVYLRRYTLTNTYTGEVQNIAHLKYTSFPDHGVPDDTSGFLKLVTLAEEEAQAAGARRPIVVHCSAGVGRTGMYIAVAITVAKLNYATTAGLLGKPPIPLDFDVLHTLQIMRQCRPGMVQTKEQLIFCYLAVLEKVITQCNILDYENERWFNKVSAHDAIDLLEREAEGAFLFRPSSARGYCSLSYKKGGQIHHVRVQISSDGFICEGDEIRYSSLQLMVQNKSAVLKVPHYSY
jgi:protein tyrosine phosphatase